MNLLSRETKRVAGREAGSTGGRREPCEIIIILFMYKGSVPLPLKNNRRESSCMEVGIVSADVTLQLIVRVSVVDSRVMIHVNSQCQWHGILETPADKNQSTTAAPQ